MKKKYVKPQNRVVELKDKLMQGDDIIHTSGDNNNPDAKAHFDEDSDGSDSSSDVWED